MLQALEKDLLSLLVRQSRMSESKARRLSQVIPSIQNSTLKDIDISLTLQAADGRHYMIIYNRDEELIVNQATEESFAHKRIPRRLRRLIAEILSEIKFSLKSSGTTYVIDGILILLAWKGDAHRLGMTKEIYPTIGAQHGVSSVSVERNMRMAIESAWSKMPYGYASKHYPFDYTSRLGRPTNQEFLFGMSRLIRHEYAEYLSDESFCLPKT